MTLLLGRGKVNDLPIPSRGFQTGEPNGFVADGVYVCGALDACKYCIGCNNSFRIKYSFIVVVD